MDRSSYTDATIDNDSLSNLLNDDQKFTQLIKKMKEGNYRLFIPSQVLIESFSGTNLERVRFRRSRLIKLYESTNFQVRFCRLIQDILKAEITTRGKFKSVPTVSHSRLYNTPLFNEGAFLSAQAPLPKQLLIHKDLRAERQLRDDALRAKVENEGYTPVWTKSLENYNPSVTPMELWPMLSSTMTHYASKRQCKLALSSRNYKALATLMHLTSLMFLLNGAPENHPLVHQLGRRDLNNWVDVFVACNASYSDFFVTEDKRLREFCNFLLSRSAITFRSISLIEFLDSKDL